jgi:hypothetical protein
MKGIMKPLIFNVVIIGIAFILNMIVGGGDILGRFATAGFVIVMLGITNLIIGGVKIVNNKENGSFYLLCGGVILLIGFSVCTRLA